MAKPAHGSALVVRLSAHRFRVARSRVDPAGRRPALDRDLDRCNTRGDHRRRRLAPAWRGRAMLIVVVDTAACAVPLAALLLAYVLLARPVWFRGRWRALSPRRVAGVAIRVHRETGRSERRPRAAGVQL
ncbi:MAG: hypothetical protein KFB96_22950 [Thiocapsa sp.]|uniref:hypothetical protein n=1 Tax=Thiocapsa sp. TaxID=2024551 RepID=UPI001BD12777|nr:hypothetical protein [Thiocapsa sp.]QVL48428.1 MAG: hypothetical protein KFB96_22950 [Thiocapsa sp.]